MSFCFDWKSLLCCKLVSDDLLVCWNHTRERETDVEIWDLGELESEMQERREEKEEQSTCKRAAAQFKCQVSLCSCPEGRRNAENMSGCQTSLWQTLQFVFHYRCVRVYWNGANDWFHVQIHKTQIEKKNERTSQSNYNFTLFKSKKCNFVWNNVICFVFCCF